MNIKINLTFWFLYDHRMLQTRHLLLKDPPLTISSKRFLFFKGQYCKEVTQPYFELSKVLFCQEILSSYYLINPTTITFSLSSDFQNILFLRLFYLLNLQTLKWPLSFHLNIKPKSKKEKTLPPSTKKQFTHSTYI